MHHRKSYTLLFSLTVAKGSSPATTHLQCTTVRATPRCFHWLLPKGLRLLLILEILPTVAAEMLVTFRWRHVTKIWASWQGGCLRHRRRCRNNEGFPIHVGIRILIRGTLCRQPQLTTFGYLCAGFQTDCFAPISAQSHYSFPYGVPYGVHHCFTLALSSSNL